jgi:hypothetical protein
LLKLREETIFSGILFFFAWCIQQMHEFAFVFDSRICEPALALARREAPDATALKAPR